MGRTRYHCTSVFFGIGIQLLKTFSSRGIGRSYSASRCIGYDAGRLRSRSVITFHVSRQYLFGSYVIYVVDDDYHQGLYRFEFTQEGFYEFSFWCVDRGRFVCRGDDGDTFFYCREELDRRGGTVGEYRIIGLYHDYLVCCGDLHITSDSEKNT